MKFPIYLDYSATTPVDPRVAQKMIPFLTEQFGNPASRSHAFGWEAEKAVEEAREHVAALLNADPKEIIWTSGATEGNNLAIKGAANFYKGKGKHIVTMKTEHKAVLDTVRELERQGFVATYLDPQQSGLLDLDKFKAALRLDTVLVSVMMVNNEIGVIQPIAEIGEICRSKGIIFHCDAVQAAGKISIDLQKLKVDLLTVTAHKVYGPKGIGALYVRRKPRVRIEPQIHGGGRERAHPRPARQAARRLQGHGRGVRQRRHGAAHTGQPQCQLQLRRGRVADHGDQGRGGFLGLGLHFGEPRALVRPAGARTLGRARPQLHPFYDRPLHHRGGDRLRGQAAALQDRQAARALALVGDVQGRRGFEHRPVGGALRIQGRNLGATPWHTATRYWTTTRTRATSALSTRPTITSAPAWSARPPAAT